MGLEALTTIWFWRPEAYTLSLCLYIAALQVIVGFVLVGAGSRSTMAANLPRRIVKVSSFAMHLWPWKGHPMIVARMHLTPHRVHSYTPLCVTGDTKTDSGAG